MSTRSSGRRSGSPTSSANLLWVRNVDIYRPFDEELHAALERVLGAAALRDPALVNAGFVRVAKLRGVVIGIYVVDPEQPLRFRLKALRVMPEYRNRGLGRWLLGHAIGLSESKGAREIVAQCDMPIKTDLLSRIGFVATNPDGEGEGAGAPHQTDDDAAHGNSQLVFTLTPE